MTEKSIRYFDLQVNGYAGVDFNSNQLNTNELEYACRKLAEDNVDGILLTIITDEFQKMINKIRNVAKLLNESELAKSIIKGIHIEGLFLNPAEGFRGAHPREFLITGSVEKAKQILDSGNGLIKLFTLAPEVDNDYAVTKFLNKNGVVVSAGHTDASISQLLGAIDNGLKLFTHLGNGTPNLLHRHDNIINRVLSLSDKLLITFIADDIHIPLFALKNYLQVIGIDQSIIITDCISAASAPSGNYSISHIKVKTGEDKIVREIGKDNLAGSAITMKEAHLLLKQKLDFEDLIIEKLCSVNPRKLFASFVKETK